MPYRNDGTPHENGIKMEQDIVVFINKCYENGNDVLGIYKDIKQKLGSIGTVSCTHAGGTGTKCDALVLCSDAKGKNYCTFGISIKRKEFKDGNPRGTFDIINTSLEKFNRDYNVITRNKIDKAYNWLNSQIPYIHSENDIDFIRDEFQDVCSSLLQEMIGDADKFFMLAKTEFFKTDILIVGKVVKIGSEERITEIFVAREKDVKMFPQENMKDNTYFLEQGNGKSSRRLMVKTANGEEFKTPYRVRCVLNNGLSAYYGLSTSNDYSTFSIKIQVDDVSYIMNQMKKFVL